MMKGKNINKLAIVMAMSTAFLMGNAKVSIADENINSNIEGKEEVNLSNYQEVKDNYDKAKAQHKKRRNRFKRG